MSQASSSVGQGPPLEAHGPPLPPQDGLRQAVAREGAHEVRAHGVPSLVVARPGTQEKPGVVVQEGERVAPHPGARREVSLEVHLPKLVGALSLEPPKVPRLSCARAAQKPFAAKDRGDRAGARHAGRPQGQKDRSDLPAAPRRMLPAYRQHRFPSRGRRRSWAVRGTAAAIHERAARGDAAPLVGRLAAHAETATKGRHVRTLRRHRRHQLLAQRR